MPACTAYCVPVLFTQIFAPCPIIRVQTSARGNGRETRRTKLTGELGLTAHMLPLVSATSSLARLAVTSSSSLFGTSSRSINRTFSTSMPFQKIKVDNPVVELDGDEMTVRDLLTSASSGRSSARTCVDTLTSSSSLTSTLTSSTMTSALSTAMPPRTR